MEKYNANSVSVKSILKIIAFVFALIVLITMFTCQVKHGSGDHAHAIDVWDSFFGADGFKGAVASFIGYILAILGGVAALVSLFVKDQDKLINLVAAALAVVGAVLIVLVKVFYVNGLKASNPYLDTKIFKLSGGPVVGCVFAGLTAVCCGLTAFVKDAE